MKHINFQTTLILPHVAVVANSAHSPEEKKRCTIRFYSSARNMVKGCCWADDQVLTDGIEDGEPYTDITFTSSQTGKVLEWVLSQGYNAYPMEPEWMFKRWKENAQWMAEV